MSLTKAELAASVCEKFGLSKPDAKILIDNFFEEICVALQQGQHIKISGFGNFELKDKNARPGRNPKTGEKYIISPRRVVVFKQGQKLKSTIEDIKLDPEVHEKDEVEA